MEANELRIGNLVRSNMNGEILKACDVLCDGINTENYEGFNYGFIEPIPLTKEWFWKFDKSITHIIQRITIKKNKSYFQTELIIGGIFFDLKTEYKIQYVHQLQNLYFALTNEELTIKNK